MTNALTWLNDLAQWLGRWVPRVVLIPPTHRGVRFGPRGSAVAVGPGLVCYWPISHDLLQVPVTTQSIQLPGQAMHVESKGVLPTVAVCVLNVQFEIIDVVQAATKILNFHALVSNRGQSIALEHWQGNMDSIGWLHPAKVHLAAEMKQYGIHIVSMDIAGMGTGVVLKNVQDYSWNDSSTGTRPKD